MFKSGKLVIRTGFTLAEVLITIVIIGVVAMLTVPSLVQNYKKKHAITAVKKFYVMMSNAIRLSEIENGDVDTWDKTNMLTDENGRYDYERNAAVNETFFTKYLAPYIVYNNFQPDYIKKDEVGNVIEQKYSSFYLADGTSVLMKNGGCVDFTIDVNADKGPNLGGIDRFTFCLCLKSDGGHCTGGRTWGTFNDNYTREQLKTWCVQNNSYYCATLVEIDGWEFRDDYPLKF